MPDARHPPQLPANYCIIKAKNPQQTWSDHGLAGLMLARSYAVAVALHTNMLQKHKNETDSQCR